MAKGEGKMTKGERMRQQVLNALGNLRYPEGLYALTTENTQHNKSIDGIIVLVRGLPSVDNKVRVK